jgi:hypothetical protein
MVDRVVSLAVALHQTDTLQPRLTVDNRTVMFKMVSIVSNLEHVPPLYSFSHAFLYSC